jgi:ATP-dependent RNA helicase RhlE
MGISAEAIHGNKSQNARQRALSNFKNRTTRILVATDIAARGIDVDDLTHVINYEIPEIAETYVHRIGRTGRAGANGISFTFCEAEETADLRDIQKLIGKAIPVQEHHPWHTVFTEIKSRPAPGQNRGARSPRNQQSFSTPGNRKPQHRSGPGSADRRPSSRRGF